MSLFDLFEMARQNATRLADACATHSAVVIEFAQWIADESKLSVTMRGQRLQAFLEGGRYFNPWEECARDAQGDAGGAIALMILRQRTWYGRRARFDRAFVNGTKFRYGALYVQGRSLVTAKYGPFSAVFRLDVAASWSQIAWLPENSLERYVPNAVDFDVDKLRHEVGSHASRHHVAALKHENEVESWRREDWATRLCHHDDDEQKDVFVEGIVAEELLPEHIDRVLVDRASWRDILRANAVCISARGMGTAEQQAKAKRYKTLRKLLEERGLAGKMEQV